MSAAKEYHCGREGGSTPDYPLRGAASNCDRPLRYVQVMARDREIEIPASNGGGNNIIGDTSLEEIEITLCG